MIYKWILILYCIIITFPGIAQEPPLHKPAIRIALLSSHIEKEELLAIEKLLKSKTDWTYKTEGFQGNKKRRSF